MNYLHIVGTEKKFILPFIEFVSNEFDRRQHKYLLLNCSPKDASIFKQKYGTKILKPYDYQNKFVHAILLPIKLIISAVMLLFYCGRSDKIYIHGLFDKKVILFFYIFKFFRKKTAWIIWGGGDLDAPGEPVQNSILAKISRSVKGGFSEYISYIEDDYKACQTLYKAKGTYKICLMYLSNVFKEKAIKVSDDDVVRILVGNSADIENNHIEILKKLTIYKGRNILIYCILSYGDKPWARNWKEHVIHYGNQEFGAKFIPVIEFMDHENYMNFLSNIDIAIFDHKYQQAMGNTITLIGMGKKVYMRENLPHWNMFARLGISIFSNDEIDLQKMENEKMLDNISIVNKYFSKSNLTNQWTDIFRI